MRHPTTPDTDPPRTPDPPHAPTISAFWAQAVANPLHIAMVCAAHAPHRAPPQRISAFWTQAAADPQHIADACAAHDRAQQRRAYAARRQAQREEPT
jgi:hypothetical protein